MSSKKRRISNGPSNCPTLIAVIGIIYGIKKDSKASIIASAALLVFIIVALLVYSYLYSQNPY